MLTAGIAPWPRVPRTTRAETMTHQGGRQCAQLGAQGGVSSTSGHVTAEPEKAIVGVDIPQPHALQIFVGLQWASMMLLHGVLVQPCSSMFNQREWRSPTVKKNDVSPAVASTVSSLHQRWAGVNAVASKN